MSAKSATGGLIVARDLEIAAWLDRLHGATVWQILRRFGLGRTQAYRRLQVLAEYGVIRRRHLTTIHPPLYTVPARSLRLASVPHAVEVSELVVCLELAGRAVATEIELRRERARQRELGGRLSDSQLETVLGCQRLPDAVELLAGGGLVAHEIELSSKGAARRGRVLAAYAASSYQAVRWIAPDPQLRELLWREVSERGLSEFMEVSDVVKT
ncbi:MAG: hypothetical protein ACRDK9_03185 [Solirubrobacterales bacterium]